MSKSQPRSQTKKFPTRNFAIFIVAFLVIGMALGPNIGQVYTGISVTGSDTVELTNNGNLDTTVRDFSLGSIGVYDVVVDGTGTANGFLKRQKLHVESSLDGALIGYQYDGIIPYQSVMQLDMDDIAITEIDGTYIPHSTRSVISGVSAAVTFKIDIPVSGGKDVWLYFGNPDVGDLSDHANTYVQYHGAATSDYLDSLVIQPPFIVEGRMTFDSTSATHNYFGVASTANGNGDSFSINQNTAYVGSRTGTYNNGAATGYSIGGGVSTDSIYKMVADGTDVEFYIDGVLKHTETSTVPTGDDMGLFAVINDPDCALVYTFIRVYAIDVPLMAFGDVEVPEVVNPSLIVGQDELYYDGVLASTLIYSDGSAYIGSSDVTADVKGSLPIIKVGTAQNIKIDHGLQYSITYVPKNMDVTSSSMFRANEDMPIHTRLIDTSGNPVSNQPLEMRARLFDSDDNRYLDEIISSTSFVIPGEYIKSGKHYQLRLSYNGFEFGGWSNEILADFDVGTEGFTITSSPDKAPESLSAASFAAASNMVGMAVTGWLDIPIIGDIIKFVADLIGVTL